MYVLSTRSDRLGRTVKVALTLAPSRDEWRYAVGRVVVDPGAKTIVQLKRDWPVEAGLELNFGGVANILLVRRQDAEVLRPKQFHLFRVVDVEKGLAYKLGFQGGEVTGVQVIPLVIERVVNLHLRSPGNQVLAFRTETVLHPLIDIVDVRLRIEAGEGAKSVTTVGVVECVGKFSALPIQPNFGRGAREIRAQRTNVIASVAAQRGAHNSLETRNPVRIQIEAAIDSAYPVEVRAFFAIGKHHSQRRLVAQVATDAAYSKVGMLSE